MFDADLSLVGGLSLEQEGVVVTSEEGVVTGVHGSLSEGRVVQETGTPVPERRVVDALGTPVETVSALFQVLLVHLHCCYHLRHELHAALPLLYHQSPYLRNHYLSYTL